MLELEFTGRESFCGIAILRVNRGAYLVSASGPWWVKSSTRSKRSFVGSEGELGIWWTGMSVLLGSSVTGTVVLKPSAFLSG